MLAKIKDYKNNIATLKQEHRETLLLKDRELQKRKKSYIQHVSTEIEMSKQLVDLENEKMTKMADVLNEKNDILKDYQEQLNNLGKAAYQYVKTISSLQAKMMS